VKWRLVVSAFSNTVLDLQWSVEHPEEKDGKDGKTPGPITEKVTAPQTSFGLTGSSNPNGVHRRPTIK